MFYRTVRATDFLKCHETRHINFEVSSGKNVYCTYFPSILIITEGPFKRLNYDNLPVQACLELSAEEYFGNLLKVEFKEKTSQQHLVAATRQLVAQKLTQHRWQRQQAWQKVLSTYLGYLGSSSRYLRQVGV
jgi:hypothetical protein